MARPKKDGMDYFSHDTDASTDEKIEALRLLYGNDGYAFYFILLERIYRTPNAELDISDAETRQILSGKIAVTVDKFEQMLETALKRECFDRDAFASRGVLTSDGIKKRFEMAVGKRIKERERTKTPQNEDKLDDSCGVSGTETPPEKGESKAKQSKQNKNNSADANSARDTFQILLGTYADLCNLYQVNPKQGDSEHLRILATSGIPPDFILNQMQEIAANRRFNSAKYFLSAIQGNWNELKREGKLVELHSGYSPKDRDIGEASAGDSYYTEIPGLIKTI